MPGKHSSPGFRIDWPATRGTGKVFGGKAKAALAPKVSALNDIDSSLNRDGETVKRIVKFADGKRVSHKRMRPCASRESPP
jgi:hypothetical protein